MANGEHSDAPEAAIPTATYRLQFNKRFTFKQAEEIIPYLDDLGVSHCYASPYLKARPGSEHGYDITDHNALNPEIGDWDDFAYALKLFGHPQRFVLPSARSPPLIEGESGEDRPVRRTTT